MTVILQSVLPFLAMIVVLIVIHELGHYITAKLANVKVTTIFTRRLGTIMIFLMSLPATKRLVFFSAIAAVFINSSSASAGTVI